MAKNIRNYQKTTIEELKEIISKLKSQVRKLKKVNKNLKSENNNLKEAWEKTENIIHELTHDIPLEDLIKHQKLPKKAIKKTINNKTNKQDRVQLTKDKFKKLRQTEYKGRNNE